MSKFIDARTGLRPSNPARERAHEQGVNMPTDRDKLIEAIAKAVLADLQDRRGIRQAFDYIDRDVYREIKRAIGEAALSVIEKAGR